MAELLSDVLERPIRYEPASVPGYGWHLRHKRGLSWTQVVVQTVLHVGLRGGDAQTVERKVEELLGRPASSLRQYIERSAALW